MTKQSLVPSIHLHQNSKILPAHRRRIVGQGLAALTLGLLSACDAGAPGAIDITGDEGRNAQAITCPTTIDPARSLFVTDTTALAQFPFSDVMGQIVSSASVAPQTALALYQQWWDTNNDAAHAQTIGPHCTDQRNLLGQPAVNGFAIDCPRQEGLLAATNPFLPGGDGYDAVGLVNRFDLAPQDGAHCGEYRIVYGKRSGQTQPFDRNLIIFEAVLPNPNPSLGLEGCRPVAEFWAEQSTITDATTRASRLRSFYFTGLTGFEPVIRYTHFLGSENGSGQLRTNQFMRNRTYLTGQALNQQWQLREYRLERSCTTSSACRLVAQLSTVKNNPAGGLFTAPPTPLASSFQNDFVTQQVARLVTNDINQMAVSTPASFNGGQSSEQDASNDYRVLAAGNLDFLLAIRNQLSALGRSDLTADNILDRATAQSCAGCHQLSNGDALGAGVTWPASNGFTHIDEQRRLSPALTGTFLPHRGSVLSQFLCGGASSLAPTASGTIGGSAVE